MRELSLNVMDIVQNSISAGAGLVEIAVEEDKSQKKLSISVMDNGKGMSAQQLENVTNPFFTTRTTRNVGLGIPLFKMEAEMTGGNFTIDSELGKGTSLKAVFCTDSVDMIPLGDINGIIHLLVTCNPDMDFKFTRAVTEETEQAFIMDTRELKEALGGEVSLAEPDVVLWIKEYLQEQTQGIGLQY